MAAPSGPTRKRLQSPKVNRTTSTGLLLARHRATPPCTCAGDRSALFCFACSLPRPCSASHVHIARGVSVRDYLSLAEKPCRTNLSLLEPLGNGPGYKDWTTSFTQDSKCLRPVTKPMELPAGLHDWWSRRVAAGAGTTSCSHFILEREGIAKLSSSRFRLARRVHVITGISLGCAAEKHAHLNCSLLEPLGNRGGTEVPELLAVRSFFEPPNEAHNFARPYL